MAILKILTRMTLSGNGLKRSRFSWPKTIIFVTAFALIGYLIFKSFALNPNLPGDLNNDNTVNITDLSILLTNYGTTSSTADINGDGQVNILDLSTLLSHYGQNYTPPSNSSSIYWGAYIEGAQTYSYLYGGTWSNAPWCDTGTQCPLPKFTSNAGKAPSIEHWGQCWTCSFDSSIASVVVQRGDIPSIDWRTSGVSNTAVSSGQYDAQITSLAKSMASWGRPLFLEFDVEMNGTWYDYSPGQLGNTASSFVAMWRHVHDLFVQAGANNVTWVWAPNVDPNHAYPSFSSMYPGDSYVDWTGLDGYNWGTQQGDSWQTFSQVYQSSYNDLKIAAPSKPIMINEIASDEAGGSKAAWIIDTLTTQLPVNYPQIKAVQWFNWRINEKGAYWNWEIESSPSSQQAFASAIASPYYAPGGSFGGLSGKIQPLP